MENLKQKSLRALIWDLFGLIASKGSGFIISVFLARLLSPEAFGLVGMASVFIVIFQVFTDVGFSSALVQRKEVSHIAYDSVFYFNVFGGLVLFIIFYFRRNELPIRNYSLLSIRYYGKVKFDLIVHVVYTWQPMRRVFSLSLRPNLITCKI